MVGMRRVLKVMNFKVRVERFPELGVFVQVLLQDLGIGTFTFGPEVHNGGG